MDPLKTTLNSSTSSILNLQPTSRSPLTHQIGMPSAALIRTTSTHYDNDDAYKYNPGTSHAPRAVHLVPAPPFPPFPVYPRFPHVPDNILSSQELVTSSVPNSLHARTTIHGPSFDPNLSDYVQSSRVFKATPHMEISCFSEHILSKPETAAYNIISFGMYQESRITIEHTYILLGVQPTHGPSFFIRLNRAAGRDRTLWLRLRSMSSKFPAEDCVSARFTLPSRKLFSGSLLYNDSGYNIVE